jgi:hypothetical protein
VTLKNGHSNYSHEDPLRRRTAGAGIRKGDGSKQREDFRQVTLRLLSTRPEVHNAAFEFSWKRYPPRDIIDYIIILRGKRYPKSIADVEIKPSQTSA